MASFRPWYVQKTYVYAISLGQRNEESLICHVHIGRKFYQLTIEKFRKCFITFKCVNRLDCKYVVKMKLEKHSDSELKNRKKILCYYAKKKYFKYFSS